MADKHSKETRSYNMSRIRSKNTTPEELVRKHLFSQGFRYRKNDPRLPGKPDIVLPKYKAVIFVNGCFWHGHEGCRYFVWPQNNADFWKKKINSNIQRDLRNKQLLECQGWNIITIWECELKKTARQTTLSCLVAALQSLEPSGGAHNAMEESEDRTPIHCPNCGTEWYVDSDDQHINE